MTISPASLRPWSDLLPELLGHVIAHLPFPADRARLRVVCRGWHSAARRHVSSQLPWLVLPDGSLVTVGDSVAYFHDRTTIPGLPEDATCVGSTDGWLALDRTDQAHRRTTVQDVYSGAFRKPSRDIKHAHAYLLHNPFSGATVPLPELDAVAGVVSEVFEVREVLVRSPSAPGDDVIAFMTSSTRCNIILCRPSRGTFVLPDYAVHASSSSEIGCMGSRPGKTFSPSASGRMAMASPPLPNLSVSSSTRWPMVRSTF